MRSAHHGGPVAPDESWAIVTSATKADPQGPNGISPDGRVLRIDPTTSPPKIVQALTYGRGATSVRSRLMAHSDWWASSVRYARMVSSASAT
jgi:hypothetical protein